MKRTKKAVDTYEQKYKNTGCAHVTRVCKERRRFTTPSLCFLLFPFSIKLLHPYSEFL